ncbi:MAG: alpha/beta family hydrolase [Chloroflexota bacterium]
MVRHSAGQARPGWAYRRGCGAATTSGRRLAAILAPGYGGSSKQPILLAMARRLLAFGVAPHAISYTRARPSGDYRSEVEDVRRARDQVLAEGSSRVALVGRSFGGRICARVAAVEPPDALVLLGHPIAPPGRPRPVDELALATVGCPTLIVQGDRDALGPLDVLHRIALSNANIQIEVLHGAGHHFGPHQDQAVQRASAWLANRLSG